MEPQLFSLFILLSILWFLVYWILGGVFFAVITIIRLGRIRMVRFSCLFTLLAMLLGVTAAYYGIERSRENMIFCLDEAQSNAEMFMALFGCGFASILGVFLLGALFLTIGGFFIMAISKSKTKPWIILDGAEEETVEIQEKIPSSKFFEG